MQKKFSSQLIILLLAILALEALSFTAFFAPIVGQLAFIVLVLATLIASCFDLEYGLLIVSGELFIGSMGHLFMLPLGSYELPIRIALWAVVMIVFSCRFIGQLLKSRGSSAYWQSLKNFRGRRTLGWLFIFIIIGLMNGIARQHGLTLIFSDFNAWLYFLLIFPAIVVYGRLDLAAVDRLKLVFSAGAIWLSLKTLFLVFIFTHNYGLSADIYNWLRQTLVGEMTPTITGWPRVFIQGQIFSAIAFCLVFWRQMASEPIQKFWSRSNFGQLILAALFLSSVLLSFSRSFWVGLLSALACSLILLWRLAGFKKMLAAVGWTILAGIFSFIMIYLVVAFPYWQTQSADFSSSFLARADSGNDAAVASRWSLLPVLLKEIVREPFFGQGFGSTVTYHSQDPRVLQSNPGGSYTTYAFEWGYLSLWLKLGLLGLGAYLLFLWQLTADSWKIGCRTKNYIFLALPAGIIFLAVTNAFTPYLNHPLGIGFLVLSSCLIWPDKVY
jgi:hypothetical protein